MKTDVKLPDEGNKKAGVPPKAVHLDFSKDKGGASPFQKAKGIKKRLKAMIWGPSGAGKTSLAEAMLYDSGTIKRLGRVEDGNTALDLNRKNSNGLRALVPGFINTAGKNIPSTSSTRRGIKTSFRIR